MKKSYFTTLSLIALVILLTSGIKETKDRTGKTGATTAGCTCHSTLAGSISLTGIPATVIKSSVNTFSLTYNAGVSKNVWGLDVKASVGTLAIGTSTGIKKSGTELTHSAPISSVGTSYTYSNMQWTAPATTGSATFNYACLGGNGDNGSGSDVYALGSFVTSVVLPIELTKFGVVKANNKANISWQTAQEINCKQFEIERSFDGKNFTAIYKKEAAGNSNVIKDYSYVDNIEGNNNSIYYRIKSVDFDGSFGYSMIQSINVKQSTLVNNVYPNPAKKNQPITVEVTSDKDQTIDFALMSIDGKMVSVKQKQVNQGFNKISLQYNNFVQSGNYFLQPKINNTLLTPINLSISE